MGILSALPPIDPPPAGLTLLESIDAVGASTVDMESDFDNTYDLYKLIITSLYFSSAGANLNCRLKVEGAYQTGADYDHHSTRCKNNTAGYAAVAKSGGSQIIIAQATAAGSNQTMNLDISIPSPHDSVTGKHIYYTGVDRTGNHYVKLSGGGAWRHTQSTQPLTGVRLFAGAGTLTGRFRLYGVNNG